jgi:4-alpha-glucanotransferase
MPFQRSSGILLHPTSLPGPYGIGDLGDNAYEFLDFLKLCRQKLWQVLPLGPTGYGDSPYQSFSAFAGNPMLISLDKLIEKGLLDTSEVNEYKPQFSEDRVDYGSVINYKTSCLQRAYHRFKSSQPNRGAFETFCHQQASWLDDYALFMALKGHYGGSWVAWDEELVQHEPAALAAAREHLTDAVGYQQFVQWLFFEQWWALKAAANERGISIIGDIPIFVAHDSADTWANQELFYLEADGRPTVVAGVPPDYFSATGQRWGNPLYRWDLMAHGGYAWWIKRFQAMLTLFDIIRIDHFRGFESYWEIPANEPTAVNGRWVPGPRGAFFEAMRNAFGGLPLIAEDLGLITPEVAALRTQFEMPGMRILQFAFGGDSTNAFLPHNYESNTVVYTGTHDNETMMGWFHRADTAGTTGDAESVHRERDYARRYANIYRDDEAHWDFIRLAWSSVADIAITPMQDLLGLGNEARMNFPSSEGGNWTWRLRPNQVSEDTVRRLTDLTIIYGRDTDNRHSC